MNRDGNFWLILVWSMFVLLIGIGLGMFWRIDQVEPQLTTAQAEIKRSHSLMVKDLTDLDVRLRLIENEAEKHGWKVYRMKK